MTNINKLYKFCLSDKKSCTLQENDEDYRIDSYCNNTNLKIDRRYNKSGKIDLKINKIKKWNQEHIKCMCRYYDADCVAINHTCICCDKNNINKPRDFECRHEDCIKTVEQCRAIENHNCSCKLFENTDNLCRSKTDNHQCICLDQKNLCKSIKHSCSCYFLNISNNSILCQSENHDCICIDIIEKMLWKDNTSEYIKNRELLKLCKDNTHNCICERFSNIYQIAQKTFHNKKQLLDYLFTNNMCLSGDGHMCICGDFSNSIDYCLEIQKDHLCQCNENDYKCKKHYKSFFNDPNKECCICLNSDSQIFGTLSCNHVYHIGCIRTWLKEHNDCPLCRSKNS
jgi:hypothetical protein